MTSVGPGRLALWWVLGVGCVLALAVVAVVSPRLGGNLLAGALAAAAVLRLVVSDAAAGGLVIRSRGLDVLMYLALAVVVAVGANAVNWHPTR
ncbi:DUF3017 domain-containing protein [Arsenicicoccus bolidensis]|uniref:DUF3017 domain-containing protein n=1 Tax=Arsenicicoccus bolidensis TaxID=229480 RepID=UPI000404A2A2|nr:DUF3017 domain-containing protein [Arsenicicoccus bolidensis]